jgi:carbamoyl-phosphate synthase large subunit
MASTGEIAAFGKNIHEAYFNAYSSVTGFRMPKLNSGVLLGGDMSRPEMEVVAKGLINLGFKLFCSSSEVEEKLNAIPYVVSLLACVRKTGADRKQSAKKIFFPVKDKRSLLQAFENSKYVPTVQAHNQH